MQVNTDRERYLELLRSGELWTRQTERRDFTPLFDRQTEDRLDARDQRPSDTASVFYSGVLAGFIYGAFAVLVWKWFR